MNRAKIKPTKLSKLSKRQKLSFLVFPIAIIYMELIFKFLTTPDFLNQGLIFMPLFSIVAGTVLSVICSCFTSKTGNILARIFLFILAFIFSTQIVYFWCFNKYLILYSVGVGGADQIIEQEKREKTLSGSSTLRCSLCGKSFSDIAESGRVGCAECYVTFYDKLLPTLRKIHGKTTHQGKVPESFTETVGAPQIDVNDLKEQLKLAIEREDFELAAQLRDEINALLGGAK